VQIDCLLWANFSGAQATHLCTRCSDTHDCVGGGCRGWGKGFGGNRRIARPRTSVRTSIGVGRGREVAQVRPPGSAHREQGTECDPPTQIASPLLDPSFSRRRGCPA
jgi:hypothetical protein